MVLDFLRERIREASEAAHVHPHRKVRPLRIRRADVLLIGIANDLFLFRTQANRRAIAFCPLTRGAVDFLEHRVVPYLVPDRLGRIKFCRVQAFPNSTFHSLFHSIFKRIKFTADIGEGEQEYDAAQAYTSELTPDDVVAEFSHFGPNDIPIIVIDEFNEITDPETPKLVANTIKALSDAGTNVTIVIVGVADNVTQLIENHESIQRCTEQIPMPRMTPTEIFEILEKRLAQLGYTISGDAKWKIANLSKGLPAYAHGLGKHACLSSLIVGGRLHLVEGNVDEAIDSLVASSDQTFKDIYEAATRSAQPDNLLRHVLTACALAKVDDSGYFRPTAVKEPLSGILGRQIDIANFQNHLKAFIDPKRKSILEREGEPRSYRFRFRQPAMQPFVLMKGLRDGIIDIDAKRVLSSPEQGDLFPNASALHS